MLSVLRLVRCWFPDHLISISANTETQFTLFDRPSSLGDHQAPRQKRRAQLLALVRGVVHLENDDLIYLILFAIGYARQQPDNAAVDGAEEPGSCTDRSYHCASGGH